MNRNRAIAGVILLAILMILMLPGAVLLFREWQSRQARVDQRSPIPSLRYCSSKQVTPCILSFNLTPDGNMLVNLLTNSRSLTNFYLKIRHNQIENVYKCRRVKRFSSSVTCLGKAMPSGEVLEFLIVSINEDIVLAEGSFPIIGLAIATPAFALSPTPDVPQNPHDR